MEPSDAIAITRRATVDWIDDNIKRLENAITLDVLILGAPSIRHDELEQMRIRTNQALHAQELNRFKNMKKRSIL